MSQLFTINFQKIFNNDRSWIHWFVLWRVTGPVLPHQGLFGLLVWSNFELNQDWKSPADPFWCQLIPWLPDWSLCKEMKGWDGLVQPALCLAHCHPLSSPPIVLTPLLFQPHNSRLHNLLQVSTCDLPYCSAFAWLDTSACNFHLSSPLSLNTIQEMKLPNVKWMGVDSKERSGVLIPAWAARQLGAHLLKWERRKWNRLRSVGAGCRDPGFGWKNVQLSVPLR